MDICCISSVVYLHLLIYYSFFFLPLNLPWWLRHRVVKTKVIFFQHGLGAVDQCMTYLSTYRQFFCVFISTPVKSHWNDNHLWGEWRMIEVVFL